MGMIPSCSPFSLMTRTGEMRICSLTLCWRSIAVVLHRVCEPGGRSHRESPKYLIQVIIEYRRARSRSSTIFAGITVIVSPAGTPGIAPTREPPLAGGGAWRTTGAVVADPSWQVVLAEIVNIAVARSAPWDRSPAVARACCLAQAARRWGALQIGYQRWRIPCSASGRRGCPAGSPLVCASNIRDSRRG